MTQGVTGVNRVASLARNMDETVAFYEEVLDIGINLQPYLSTSGTRPNQAPPPTVTPPQPSQHNPWSAHACPNTSATCPNVVAPPSYP